VDFTSLDDAALLAIISRANTPNNPQLSAAVGALYDRYGRLVYSVAIHIVGDSATAEEITQDVFVRAWEGAHTYRPETAQVSSWLASIAHHRAIDELRRSGTRPEKDRADWPDDIGLDSADGLQPVEGPENEVEAILEGRHIRQVIASLPTVQRQVLSLAFYKGLTHNEISELLGEPLGTVKSRLRLAMQKLRKMLVSQGDEEK